MNRDTIMIELPLPPAVLHPNARTHWAAKARSTKRYRNSAYLRSLEVLNGSAAPMWKAATVRAAWYFKTKRNRDLDGLVSWAKAAFDGLQDAGIVANDSGLTHLPHNVYIDRDRSRVVLTVEKKP
jgi:Holliday junction resolvase RusA-like endonuclease